MDIFLAVLISFILVSSTLYALKVPALNRSRALSFVVSNRRWIGLTHRLTLHKCNAFNPLGGSLFSWTIAARTWASYNNPSNFLNLIFGNDKSNFFQNSQLGKSFLIQLPYSFLIIRDKRMEIRKASLFNEHITYNQLISILGSRRVSTS